MRDQKHASPTTGRSWACGPASEASTLSRSHHASPCLTMPHRPHPHSQISTGSGNLTVSLWPLRGMRSACAKDITCGVALLWPGCSVCACLCIEIAHPTKLEGAKENLVLSPQQQMWTIVGFLPAVDESMIYSRQQTIKTVGNILWRQDKPSHVCLPLSWTRKDQPQRSASNALLH